MNKDLLLRLVEMVSEDVRHWLLTANDSTMSINVRVNAEKNATHYYRLARSRAKSPVVVPF